MERKLVKEVKGEDKDGGKRSFVAINVYTEKNLITLISAVEQTLLATNDTS